MPIYFSDTERGLADSLVNVKSSLTGTHVTLGKLLELVGEQGMLLFVTILMIPFLLPVSIPGVSTVFSIAVILVGAGITLNRVPWLPRSLLERQVAVENLVPALDKGQRLMRRLEVAIRPRWLAVTNGTTRNRAHGIAMIVAGILLLFPLGLVPFSNTFPGIAVLLLAVGLAQRDGLFILLGYAMVGVTIIYFGALAYAVLVAGASLRTLDFATLRNLLPW